MNPVSYARGFLAGAVLATRTQRAIRRNAARRLSGHQCPAEPLVAPAAHDGTPRTTTDDRRAQ